VLIDCLIDVAFEAAKRSNERWADFTDADRVRWISQFAEAAIEHFDSL
jgi:acyl-CoA reductase-like NAD-dependent aldehyde dehydrogenase